jgi:hypothetical protein
VADCPLCSIPQREKVLYQDELLYLASTKLMKGHKVRVMACINRHSAEPTFEERLQCAVKLVDYMRLYAGEFVICDNTQSSIPSHWHLMACDTDGHGDPQLYNTPRVRFP